MTDEAPLVFSPPRRLTRGDVAALDPVARAQLERTAAKSFRGMSFENALLHVQSNDSSWEHFQVSRGDKPVFDAWLAGGDCGRLFQAGSKVDAGVFMVQSDFDAEDASPYRELVAELTRAYVDMLRRKRTG
jgi:hypothetical protein